MVHVLLFTMLNVLYHYISAFLSMCAVPNTAVCCSPLTSCFSVMLLRYCLNDTAMVPVAPVVTGIIFVFTFHMRCISIVRFVYILESSRLSDQSTGSTSHMSVIFSHRYKDLRSCNIANVHRYSFCLEVPPEPANEGP